VKAKSNTIANARDLMVFLQSIPEPELRKLAVFTETDSGGAPAALVAVAPQEARLYVSSDLESVYRIR